MRAILLFSVVIAAFLLAGCVSDKEMEKIERAIIEQAVNDTANSLNPLKCKAGTACRGGVLIDVRCESGKAVDYPQSSPYSCSGNTLIVSSCNGDQLTRDMASGATYCDVTNKVRDLSCQGGSLKARDLDAYEMCYNTDTGGSGIEIMTCANGAPHYERGACANGTKCYGSGGVVACS